MMTTKSISELGKWKWKGKIPSSDQNSGTELRFYKLHNVPISELDIADVRFLIGQNEGLSYLVPIAIEALKEDLLFEAEYYEGDLLSVLLQINDTNGFWKTHVDLKNDLLKIYTEQKAKLTNLSDDTRSRIKTAFIEFEKS